MKHLRVLSILSALVISACSGSGGESAGTITTSLPPAAPNVVKTSWVFGPPKSAQSGKRPAYVTANIESVKIALNTVNGGSPPGGLTTTVTTNIALSSCPCNVPGPSVPPGLDSFTITAYDGTSGAGNVVSTASGLYSIAAGQANTNTITLDGVPASFSITGVPSGAAGTAFSPQSVAVSVKDADGNTIMGTYENAVNLSDSDASGATTLATSGSDSPPTGTLLSSNDSVTLSYTGLAIVPATITASASGATSGNATFTPTLQPISYSGPLVLGSPEIDLYAASGTGSTGSFSVSETGWTNAPYNRGVTATMGASCSSIASVSPSSGTSFTVSVVGSPTAGVCTLTLSDGAGQAKSVTVTYTTSSFGVQ